MALTEAHNNYVQQLHAANGMVDQYYKDTLPQLLQVRKITLFKQFSVILIFFQSLVFFVIPATFCYSSIFQF